MTHKGLGYYMYPCIYGDKIAFVYDYDLWCVDVSGGAAQRLTCGMGRVSYPAIDSSGNNIAFSSEDEGHVEIYTIPINSGQPFRVTYLGEDSQVVGWTKSNEIIFSSTKGQAFSRISSLYKIPHQGGIATPLNLGPSRFISYAPDHKASVMQRRGYREYGYWKQYRGGTAGQILIDKTGNSDYELLIKCKGDMARPLWINDRIYFVSDHEGVGNLYSCKADGSDLRAETKHKDFYVRNQSTDGKNIVYQCGGDIFVFNPQYQASTKVDIKCHSSMAQKARKFVNGNNYLHDYDLHKKNTHTLLTARGKGLMLANTTGPVHQFGRDIKGRLRFASWLFCGEKFVAIHDEPGEDVIEMFTAKDCSRYRQVSLKQKLGRVIDLRASPTKPELVVLNHAQELIHVNLKEDSSKVIDQGKLGFINGYDISPDGNWVVYSCPISINLWAIKLYDIKNGKTHQITEPVLRDVDPQFDKSGKYIFFKSYREFEPSWDQMHFELSFQKGSRPYLILLDANDKNPFIMEPSSLEEIEKKEEDKSDKKTKKKKKEEEATKVDLDGVKQRVIAFPIANGKYSDIQGIKGKAFFLVHIENHNPEEEDDDESGSGSLLQYYDFEDKKVCSFANDIIDYTVSTDGTHLTYINSEMDIRVVKTDTKPEFPETTPAHKQRVD